MDNFFGRGFVGLLIDRSPTQNLEERASREVDLQKVRKSNSLQNQQCFQLTPFSVRSFDQFVLQVFRYTQTYEHAQFSADQFEKLYQLLGFQQLDSTIGQNGKRGLQQLGLIQHPLLLMKE